MFDQSTVTSIVQHMNEDHAEAVSLYLLVFAGVRDASNAVLTSIDANGMDIRYRLNDEEQIARVAFDPPLMDAREVRSRLVSMVNSARQQLSD